VKSLIIIRLDYYLISLLTINVTVSVLELYYIGTILPVRQIQRIVPVVAEELEVYINRVSWLH
jgi:hypothetical protein